MNNGLMMTIAIEDHIRSSLKEDIPVEDITTNPIFSEKSIGNVQLISKGTGIIAGLSVFEKVFQTLDSTCTFSWSYKDGDLIKEGDLIGVIKGSARVILSGERTALNYLQRMSGIATFTNRLAMELKGTNTKLLDTRKTTPGLRVFEKYSVKIGGGYNHRFNLSDGILIKDNHISAAGGISNAIKLVREYSYAKKIEVETENLDMVNEALEASADIIMLDNMDDSTIEAAVKLIGKRALTECSGNISLERIRIIASLGVDFISVGAITHSAPILDFSLKNLKLE